MASAYERHGGSVIAVEDVPREQTYSYGIVAVDEAVDIRTSLIVEQPKPADVPSTQAVVGRCLLVPDIFHKLETIGRGAGGEIQLTDAIADLLQEKPVHALSFAGQRCDCGSKLGYLKATIANALTHPEIADEFQQHLRSRKGS